MLANNRMASVNGRDRKDRNSIAATSGATNSGVPSGRNSEKKCKPWRAKPTITTRMKTIMAKPKVTAMWLVGVKLCTKGTMPMRLHDSTKMNTAKINGA